MNKSATPDYDVFLSHTPADADIAGVVAQQFRANGMSVFDPTDLPPGFEYLEGIRQGIQDSLVFVVLVTPSSLQAPQVAFEYGTAWGWSTPAYVLVAGSAYPQFLAPPAYLRELPRFSYPSELPNLVAEVRQRSAPLSDDEKRALEEAYARVGVPIDRLLSDPASSARLAERFAERSHRQVQSFRLIRELLRLRKTKRLPRLATPAPR